MKQDKDKTKEQLVADLTELRRKLLELEARLKEHPSSAVIAQEREERYRSLFENSLDAVLLTVPDGRILAANPAACRLFGRTEEDICKVGRQGLVDLNDPRLKEALKTRRRTGEFRGEITLRRSDGSKFEGGISSHIYQTADGQVRTTLIIRDISERKQVEEALKESEEFRTILLENSPYPVVVRDLNDAVIYVNPAFEKLTGFSAAEAVGTRIPALWWPGKDRSVSFKKKQISWHKTETRLQKKNGELIWAEVTSGPIVKDGQLKYYLANWVDITERKNAEKKLKQSEEFSVLLRDMSPNPVVLIGPDASIGYVNPAFEKLTGYSAAEAIGLKSPFPWWSAEDRANPERIFRISERDSFYRLERRMKNKRGEDFWVELSSVPVSINNKYLYHLSNWVDITERKQAEMKNLQLVALVESSDDAMLRVDINGRVSSWNKGAEKLYGYTETEAIGLPMLAFISPDRQAEDREIRTKVLRGENLQNFETVRLRKGGQGVEVSLTISAIRDKSGNVIGSSTVARDITRRKQAEAEIRIFSQAVDGAIDAIAITDTQGIITYANTAMEETCGYRKEELQGTSVITLTAHPELVNQLISTIIRQGRWVGEIEAVRKNGEIFPMLLSLSTVKNEEGHIIALLGAARDITRQKQLAKEREELTQKAYLSSRLSAVGQMAAGIAHEVNNPLTSVIGFTDLLRAQKDVPDSIRNDLQIVSDNAHRVSKIIRDLLAFARGGQTEKDQVDINEILRTTIALRAHQMEVDHIKVTSTLENNLPRIMASGGQLQQVFLNLLLNAEQAVRQAHGKGNLIISSGQNGNAVRVTITDDGPGISAKNMGRLFEPFFTTKPPGEGVGLGLSVCYTIIKDHCGKIWAESQEGLGATFSVELPVAGQE